MGKMAVTLFSTDCGRVGGREERGREEGGGERRERREMEGRRKGQREKEGRERGGVKGEEGRLLTYRQYSTVLLPTYTPHHWPMVSVLWLPLLPQMILKLFFRAQVGNR